MRLMGNNTTGNRLFFLALVVTSIAMFGTLSSNAEAQARLAMGGTHSGSSFYSYQVAVVTDWNENVDGVDMSIQELGGASASTQALLRHEVDMGIAVTSSDHQAMAGEGDFRAPADNLRTLYYFAPLPNNLVVAKDSDIQTFEDFAGAQVNPGGRGTATERQVETIFDTLGIEPNYYRAGGSDALEAYQNRNLDAFVKSGLHPDGYIQQAHSSRPVRLLSMDREQAQQVADSVPYFSVAEIDPADHYGEQQSSLITLQTGIGINTTNDLPEDVAYAIVERAFSEEGIKAAADGYSLAAQTNPLQLTLDASVAPLHAGVVRYLEDNGHDVPMNLIPPEYNE